MRASPKFEFCAEIAVLAQEHAGSFLVFPQCSLEAVRSEMGEIPPRPDEKQLPCAGLYLI
jgi:hypothetical protein